MVVLSATSVIEQIILAETIGKRIGKTFNIPTLHHIAILESRIVIYIHSVTINSTNRFGARTEPVAYLSNRKKSLYDTKLLTYFYEGCYCLVKVLLLVSGRELHADTSLTLWNNRIVETGNKDTLLSHLLCKHL